MQASKPLDKACGLVQSFEIMFNPVLDVYKIIYSVLSQFVREHRLPNKCWLIVCFRQSSHVLLIVGENL